MYVAVHHQIDDPDTYWNIVREGAANLPAGISLHHCIPSPDGKQAMCVWEGDSLGAVKDFVESAVGSVSRNEYFEAEAREGVHLPSAVSTG